MDLVLHYADEYLSLDSIYLSPALSLARDNIFRQAVSLFFITLIGGYLVYLIPASLSFWFIYDKNDMKHTRFLPNQVNMLNYHCYCFFFFFFFSKISVDLQNYNIRFQKRLLWLQSLFLG